MSTQSHHDPKALLNPLWGNSLLTSSRCFNKKYTMITISFRRSTLVFLFDFFWNHGAGAGVLPFLRPLSRRGRVIHSGGPTPHSSGHRSARTHLRALLDSLRGALLHDLPGVLALTSDAVCSFLSFILSFIRFRSLAHCLILFYLP
jgi:hypothetical protein